MLVFAHTDGRNPGLALCYTQGLACVTAPHIDLGANLEAISNLAPILLLAFNDAASCDILATLATRTSEGHE